MTLGKIKRLVVAGVLFFAGCVTATPAGGPLLDVRGKPSSSYRIEYGRGRPFVKVGTATILAEREAQRLFDPFVSVEFTRASLTDDPKSAAIAADLGFAHETVFFGFGVVRLIPSWEHFGAGFLLGADIQRRYGIDEARLVVGFYVSLGGF